MVKKKKEILPFPAEFEEKDIQDAEKSPFKGPGPWQAIELTVRVVVYVPSQIVSGTLWDVPKTAEQIELMLLEDVYVREAQTIGAIRVVQEVR